MFVPRSIDFAIIIKSNKTKWPHVVVWVKQTGVENMEITRYLCPLAVCSLFYACIFMWDIDSVLWKPVEKKNIYIYILALGFYEIFFLRGKKSKPFIKPASLSKSVKNIRIHWSKGESTCVYFFSSYFSTGKSQRQRYFSASHVSVWYIGMEEGLFLWRLWFPFPISPTFVCRRYQVKEQPWIEERTEKKERKEKKKDTKAQKDKQRKMKTGRGSQLDGKLELEGTSANWFPDFSMQESEVQSL